MTWPHHALLGGRVRVALGVLFFKTTYLGLLCAAVWLWGNFDTELFGTMMARWPRDRPPVFASHFATWDTAYYLYLSEVGYDRGAPSCAFYPLWPLLVRWCSPVFGGSYMLSGIALANLFSLAGWVLFHRLIANRWGVKSANWSLAFLIAFPGALFFQFNYTESLFLFLVLVLWWGLTKGHYGWACLAASMLPLTRGPGVFAVLPIGWHLLQPARVMVCNTSTEKGTGHRALQALTDRIWLMLAPILGWGLYLALMWRWTGNPFEGIQAQRYWGVHSISNLWNVPKFIIGLFTPTEWHAFRGSVLDRSVFVLLVYCLPLLRRLDKELLIWIYMLGILPAMSGTFTSFTRFASCAFPMFIALGVFLGRREWQWLRYGLFVIFVALQIVLLWRFVNFRWAS